MRSIGSIYKVTNHHSGNDMYLQLVGVSKQGSPIFTDIKSTDEWSTQENSHLLEWALIFEDAASPLSDPFIIPGFTFELIGHLPTPYELLSSTYPEALL